MYIPTRQTYSDILRHHQESSGIFRRIQAYPESCATLAYSAIQHPPYSEPMHIQN